MAEKQNKIIRHKIGLIKRTSIGLMEAAELMRQRGYAKT